MARSAADNQNGAYQMSGCVRLSGNADGISAALQAVESASMITVMREPDEGETVVIRIASALQGDANRISEVMTLLRQPGVVIA